MEHQSRKQVVLPGGKWTTEKGQKVWHMFDEGFFPNHKSCQNRLSFGCYTRFLHVQYLHACCFAESRSSVRSFLRHYLENRNQCLVSHMSTDLPSSSKRLNLMIWTLPLIWGQKIQELVKYLKSFLGKFALASKPKERTPYLLTQKMKLQDPLSSLILVIMPGFKVQEERPVLPLKNYIKIELVKSSSWYEQWLVAMKILTG